MKRIEEGSREMFGAEISLVALTMSDHGAMNTRLRVTDNIRSVWLEEQFYL